MIFRILNSVSKCFSHDVFALEKAWLSNVLFVGLEFALMGSGRPDRTEHNLLKPSFEGKQDISDCDSLWLNGFVIPFWHAAT